MARLLLLHPRLHVEKLSANTVPHVVILKEHTYSSGASAEDTRSASGNVNRSLSAAFYKTNCPLEYAVS